MADVNTLFRNAKFFNEESSTIYEVTVWGCNALPVLATPFVIQYADQLHKIAKARHQQLTNPVGLCPPVSSATPSPAPPTSEPAVITKDVPINPNVGAIFDEIKKFTVSDEFLNYYFYLFFIRVLMVEPYGRPSKVCLTSW